MSKPTKSKKYESFECKTLSNHISKRNWYKTWQKCFRLLEMNTLLKKKMKIRLFCSYVRLSHTHTHTHMAIEGKKTYF